MVTYPCIDVEFASPRKPSTPNCWYVLYVTAPTLTTTRLTTIIQSKPDSQSAAEISLSFVNPKSSNNSSSSIK